MGIDELCTLPVADLAAPDSVLFVGYVPAAPGGPAAHQGVGLHLQERCFRLVEEKPQVRGLVLWPGLLDAGQRGGLPAGNTGTPKRQAANVHQFIIAPIQEHSRKPEEAREKIVALMGDVPRVELFARQSPARLGCVGERGGKHRPGLLDKVSRGGRERKVDLCPM